MFEFKVSLGYVVSFRTVRAIMIRESKFKIVTVHHFFSLRTASVKFSIFPGPFYFSISKYIFILI